MQKIEDLRRVTVLRYITPLREGGSLPALASADDGFNYVLKFRGSGQGVRSLIAELIGGEMARFLGFKVPELVFADLGEEFGRTEGDEEIQDLLKWSSGLNLALHYLSGAINFDPAVMKVDHLLASKIVWLDAFLTNIDRSYRNTNMLMWHNELWLIDHGSTLYFHHSWKNWKKKAETAFPYSKEHTLLSRASKLEEANEEFKAKLNTSVIDNIVELIPDEWLEWEGYDETPSEKRGVYKEFLRIRLAHADLFTKEAENARRT